MNGKSFDPKEATKRALDEIYKLIDQPGISLRDGIDYLDFEKMEGEDLSTLSVSEADSHKLLLVDSREKMIQCIKQIEVSYEILDAKF